MADSNGGDGTGVAVTGEAPTQIAPPIQGEVSQTQEELEAKIEEELGLPHTASEPSEPVAEPEAPAEDEPAESPEEEPEQPPEEEAEPVAAEPSDKEFFIEVEDAEGVTHKISQIEDLPEDFVAKNNRQGYEILSKLQKLDTERSAYEAEQAETAATKEATETQQAQFDAWDKEIDSLAKSKRIDVKDTERINKVFEHIGEINALRAKNGNPNLLTSFEDGLDKFEAQEAKNNADSKEQQENDRAKLKSRLIGGSSTAATGASRPYVSGSYRDIDDVPL